MFFRKIDDLRRITIPHQIMEKMGLSMQTRMQIRCTENEIILTPAIVRCKFCESSENLLKDIAICKECAVRVRDSLAEEK